MREDINIKANKILREYIIIVNKISNKDLGNIDHKDLDFIFTALNISISNYKIGNKYNYRELQGKVIAFLIRYCIFANTVIRNLPNNIGGKIMALQKILNLLEEK